MHTFMLACLYDVSPGAADTFSNAFSNSLNLAMECSILVGLNSSSRLIFSNNVSMLALDLF